MGLGVDSASTRNEYQEYFLGGKGGRCVQLTNLPPSCADCLEIWEPHTPGTLRGCSGLYRDGFNLPHFIFIFYLFTSSTLHYKVTLHALQLNIHNTFQLNALIYYLFINNIKTFVLFKFLKLLLHVSVTDWPSSGR